MIIALRRGTDWVATGIYNATDTRPDGSPRFNPASDYVVKYTLKNITGDTATYKNPVRIAAGMTSPNYYGNGQVSSSGKTTPVYCVQHDDGTVYVLDGYDPWAKMYFEYRQMRTSQGQYTYVNQTTNTNIFEFISLLDNEEQASLFRLPTVHTNYLVRPAGYTNQMSFNSDKTLASIQHFYKNPTTGAQTPFTHWYLDPNGIPIEFGGQATFAYYSFNDLDSLSMGNLGMPGTFDRGKTHSMGYHQLFFQNERASFVNAMFQVVNNQLQTDLNNHGTQIQLDFINLISSTTMQLTEIKYSLSRYPTSAGDTVLVETKDGMYINSSGKRYDVLIYYYNIGSGLMTNGLAIPMTDINTLDSSWYSEVGALTQITIPSITPSDTTISFANVPAPVYSTTNVLYKNVDYIMTGLYAPGQFLNDIVVKCKINGQIGKYKVCSANGDLSLFFIQYTNPTTGAVTNYKLDSFDPYDRYYNSVTAENSRPTIGRDRREVLMNLVLSNLVKQNNNNFNYYRNQFLAKDVSPFFRPVNYQRVVGNQLADWGLPPTAININDFGTYNTDRPNAVISEADRYRLTYTYNNNTAEYSVVAFTNDPAAQVPIQHSGELYFMDPSALRQSNLTLKDMSYHQFFYEGETAGFYNRPGPLNNNSITVQCADIFGNLPFPGSGARVNTSIPGAGVIFDNDWNQSASGGVSIPGVYSRFPDRSNNSYNPTRVYMAQDTDPFSSVIWLGDRLSDVNPVVLRCSISLHTAHPIGSANWIEAWTTENNLPPRPSSPNQNIKFISYVQTLGAFLNSRGVVLDTCIVLSPCGLYTDAQGNRYDYVTIVNNAGYYVPVESLTNQIPMADITAATGGFLVGKVLPGTSVTLDAAAVAALSGNSGSGTSTTTGGTGTTTGSGTGGGTDTGGTGTTTGSGTGGGTTTGGTDTGGTTGTTGGTGTTTGSGTGGGTDTGGTTEEATFLNIPVSKLQAIGVFAGAVGILVAVWYFGGLGGAAVGSTSGSALYAGAL